jgi:hypothetical protein
VRLDEHNSVGSVLRFVGWILVAIGAVAAVLSIVLLFVGG